MNLQTALKLLLLSCSFTTNASAIINSMEGKKDEAVSSSDALFVRKLLSSEEVGNGVTRYSGLPVNNWNEAKGFCADHGLALATKSQICPNGPLQPPIGGTLTGDQWIATADGFNKWVQLGPIGGPRLCKSHFENHAHYPGWGTDNSKAPNESNYLYCFKTPTPEPTMFPTSVPTSKPTTFSEGIEAAVGDGCKNGIEFVTSFTTETVACDKVTFCDGSTSNSIFNPNVENVCIDFTKADEECTNLNVITTFDNAWRMNALSLTSSDMGAETDPEQVVMKGSNDMNTWIELFNSPLVFTERKKPKDFFFPNNDMFKYYSLTFERNENSSKMHIGHYGLVEVYTKSCSIQFFEGISDYSFE